MYLNKLKTGTCSFFALGSFFCFANNRHGQFEKLGRPSIVAAVGDQLLPIIDRLHLWRAIIRSAYKGSFYQKIIQNFQNAKQSEHQRLQR